MPNNPVIIIGNKPNKYLDLSKLVDNYETNYRCNFGLAGFNNTGIKKSYLGLCSHMYQNLVVNKLSKEELIFEYIEYFERSFIEKVFDSFNASDYEEVFHAKSNRFKRIVLNLILVGLGSEHKFKKLPRTGFVIIFKNLLKRNYIFLSNFTVNYNKRESFYVKNHKDFESIHHDSKSEIDLLRWLHIKKYIDLTFCLLEDSTELVLDCGDKQIKPSLHGLKKLSELEKSIILKNLDFNLYQMINFFFGDEVNSKKFILKK